MGVSGKIHPIDARLAESGLVLPEPPKPAGKYKAVIRSEGLLFLSGQFPLVEGDMRFCGQVCRDLSIEEGREAARLAGLNVLTHIRAASRGWTEFGEVVRMEGHVSSAPGWYDQPGVLDGASELFAEVLGEQAGHARTAFAASQLPLNATVELVVIASMKRG